MPLSTPSDDKRRESSNTVSVSKNTNRVAGASLNFMMKSWVLMPEKFQLPQSREQQPFPKRKKTHPITPNPARELVPQDKSQTAEIPETNGGATERAGFIEAQDRPGKQCSRPMTAPTAITGSNPSRRAPVDTLRITKEQCCQDHLEHDDLPLPELRHSRSEPRALWETGTPSEYWPRGQQHMTDDIRGKTTGAFFLPSSGARRTTQSSPRIKWRTRDVANR